MAATTDDLEKLSWLSKTFGVSTSTLDVLDLARDPNGEGVEARAEGLEAESRELNIDKANKNAQEVLNMLGDLLAELNTLVGQEAPVAVTLATCIKEEAEARNHPAFSKTEPVRALYQQAKAQVEHSLAALKQAIEEARKAVAEEKLRRQNVIDDANNKAQSERSTVDALVAEGNTLVGDSHEAPGKLVTALKEDEESRVDPAFAVEGVERERFEQASANVALKLTSLKQAIDKAREAVAKEKLRRQNRTDLLLQRMLADPLSKLATVSQSLAEKDEKKPDVRMTPIREQLQGAQLAAQEALPLLQNAQAAALGLFNTLAQQAEDALDTLAQCIHTAEAHRSARVTFRQATQQHKDVLSWGADRKNAELETRVAEFRNYWRSLDQIQDWTVLASHVGNQLPQWVAILEQVQRDLKAWETRVPLAQRDITEALDLHQRLLSLCERLGEAPEGIGGKYPNLAELHGHIVKRDHETDQMTLKYPGVDLGVAFKYMAEVEQRWNPLLGPCEQELAQLDEAVQLKPIVSGAVVIRWSPNLNQGEVVNALPRGLGNGASVASDIINQAMGGKTGFQVSGHEIYHSSAGSGRVSDSQMGTAFWILQIAGDANSSREIVAMGKHHGNKSDEYRIIWKASGVSCPQDKVVKLQDGKKKLS